LTNNNKTHTRPQIKIPFSHVLKITKGTTALLIPNSINIVTSRKEYCFRSFWDRDECYYQMAAAYRTYRRLPPAPRDALFDSRSIDKDGVMEASAAAVAAAAAAAAAATATASTGSSPFSSSAGAGVSSAASEAAAPSRSASPSPPLPLPLPQSATTSSSASGISPSRPAPPSGEDRTTTGTTTAPSRVSCLGFIRGLLSLGGSDNPLLTCVYVQATLDACEDGGDEQGSVSSYDEDDMLDFDDLREGALNQVSVVSDEMVEGLVTFGDWLACVFYAFFYDIKQTGPGRCLREGHAGGAAAQGKGAGLPRAPPRDGPRFF